MYFVISCFLALAVLFSLPEYIYAMNRDLSSSGSFVGPLPQTDSAILNRALAALLTRQQSRTGLQQPTSVFQELLAMPEVVVTNSELVSALAEVVELDLSREEREITAELLEEYAKKYPGLKKLKISGLVQNRRLIKGELLKVIVRCFPELEELDISYNDFTAEDLGALGMLKNLKRLSINSLRVMDAGIQALVNAGVAIRLTHLEANFNSLSDVATRLIFERFSALIHLSIVDNFIKNTGLILLRSKGYKELNDKSNLEGFESSPEFKEWYEELLKKEKKEAEL